MKVADSFLIANLILVTKFLDLTAALSYGNYLNVSTYAVLESIGLYGCSRACGVGTDCRAFSFHVSTLRCGLHMVDATQTPPAYLSSPGYVYGDKDTIIQDATVMGPCVDHTCPAHYTCVVLHSHQTACVISACDAPPQLAGTDIITNTSIPVGHTYTFSCLSSYTLVKAPATITCLARGNWSVPTFQCLRECGEPVPVSNADVSAGSNIVGESRTYTCYSGFSGVGNPYIVCEGSGLWTTPSITCNENDD